MDIQKIKHVVNSDLSDPHKKQLLFDIMCENEALLPNMLELLARERKHKQALLGDMNLELSRADIYIEDYSKGDKNKKQSINKEFILSNITSFYEKYKGGVTHCFNK